MQELLYDRGECISRPLRGDTMITFVGAARARFRLQHTCDRGGAPDELLWADVTRVSDASHAPEDAIDASESVVRGVLVDWVEGYAQVRYRRHKAAWIRVVPFDLDDEENVEHCKTFEVLMETTDATR